MLQVFGRCLAAAACRFRSWYGRFALRNIGVHCAALCVLSHLQLGVLALVSKSAVIACVTAECRRGHGPLQPFLAPYTFLCVCLQCDANGFEVPASPRDTKGITAVRLFQTLQFELSSVAMFPGTQPLMALDVSLVVEGRFHAPCVLRSGGAGGCASAAGEVHLWPRNAATPAPPVALRVQT